MSNVLLLKPSCQVRGCGSTSSLYASNCKHMTLCLPCGKAMTKTKAKCYLCGAIVTRLIQEYNVVCKSTTDKSFFIGKFNSGLPCFSETENHHQWSLRQNNDERGAKKLLLDENGGGNQYQGQQERVASYYVLMKEGEVYLAAPVGSWFNFNKVAQCSTQLLTLEEAEEKMGNRQKTNRDACNRWTAKGGNFKGDDDGKKKEEEREKREGDEFGEEGNVKCASEDEDLHDGSDKGSDWEHEEVFTDDDEGVEVGDSNGRKEEEGEAYFETKKDEDGSEEEVGLSENGKELKKLLGRNGGMNSEEDEDKDDDEENVNLLAKAPQQKLESKPVSKEKRKLDDYEANKQASNTALSKKMKTEDGEKDRKLDARDNAAASVRSQATSIMKTSFASSPAFENQIRAVLMKSAPMKLADFLGNFPENRKYSKEEKDAFSKILRKVAWIQKKDVISYLKLKM